MMRQIVLGAIVPALILAGSIPVTMHPSILPLITAVAAVAVEVVVVVVGSNLLSLPLSAAKASLEP